MTTTPASATATRRGPGARWPRSRPRWAVVDGSHPAGRALPHRCPPRERARVPVPSRRGGVERRHRGGDQSDASGGRARRRHPPHRLPGPRHRQRPAPADRRARHGRRPRACLRRRRSRPTRPTCGAPGLFPAACRRPTTLYLLLFTSGSTGAPKAVRVSQGRLADAGRTMATGAGFTADDVLYCAMPMFHGNALNTCIVPAMASGACLVLRRRFSASGFLPDVRRYGVTYFNYVGRALAYILATPILSPTTVRTRCASASAPTRRRRTSPPSRSGSDCPIVEGYGSSEGAISMSRVPGTPRQAMGMPPPGTEVAIVDPVSGHECPPARHRRRRTSPQPGRGHRGDREPERGAALRGLLRQRRRRGRAHPGGLVLVR